MAQNEPPDSQTDGSRSSSTQTTAKKLVRWRRATRQGHASRLCCASSVGAVALEVAKQRALADIQKAQDEAIKALDQATRNLLALPKNRPHWTVFAAIAGLLIGGLGVALSVVFENSTVAHASAITWLRGLGAGTFCLSLLLTIQCVAREGTTYRQAVAETRAINLLRRIAKDLPDKQRHEVLASLARQLHLRPLASPRW